MTTSSTPVRLDTSVVGGRSSVEETLAVGQHFTPAVTADFLCEQVRASISKPLGPVRVADPAAGEGALLRPLALQSHNTCIGIERDEPVASRGTDVGVKVGDGLFDDRLALGSFDVVVANPPFGRASNLLEEHQWDQLVAGDAYSIWGPL
ncbi:MAG: SAM-dependent DNA methyltransferase, partial [Gemmatimonadetes bacterium]|nr:SAM-dependent DNA methyltransferase [Gemmatimonadota bacterium]